MTLKHTSHLAWILIFWALGSSASALHTIEGTIRQYNSEFAAGAQVQLLNTSRSVIEKVLTDKKGYFLMKRIPDGTYSLEVTLEGSQKYEERLDLDNFGSNNHKLDIMLHPRTSELSDKQGTPAARFYLPLEQTINADALKLFEKGLALDAEKKYDKSLEKFEEAAKLDPTFSRAFTHIGIAQQHLNKNPEAIIALEKAIELNPNDPIPYINLGGILNHEKRYAEAIPKLVKAVELDQQIAKAHLYLGQTYYNNGNYQEAIKPLETAGSLDPTDCAIAYGILGNAHFQLQDYRQARVAFKRYVELDPTNPKAEKIKETIAKLDEALSEATNATPQ